MPRPRNSDSQRRVSRAYELTKQAILSGELAPGQQLVETVLAERLDVSRTPIREALTRLEYDGLVERNSRGLVVREPTIEELLDIYETRDVLETAAARSAAERRTEHNLRLIESLAANGRALEPDVDDPEIVAQMVETNRRFHESVWHASHNESLIDLLERLHLHLARYPATTLVHPGRWERSNEQHDELVKAIAARKAATAGRIASRHFSEAREIRLELWRNNMI